MTKLVENDTTQDSKLKSIERKNSTENAKILSEVRDLNTTLQDHMQNGVDLISRQKATEDSVASLDTRFADYVTENAELIEGMQTAKHALGEIKTALRTYLIRGLVALLIGFLVYRFCPGLKPMLASR